MDTVKNNSQPNKGILKYGGEFLHQLGHWGDAQKNDLILNTMCVVRQLRHVSFDINTHDNEIVVNLYLRPWSYLFSSRNKILRKLIALYSDRLREYSIRFRFFLYGTKENTGRSVPSEEKKDPEEAKKEDFQEAKIDHQEKA